MSRNRQGLDDLRFFQDLRFVNRPICRKVSSKEAAGALGGVEDSQRKKNIEVSSTFGGIQELKLYYLTNVCQLL